MRPVVSIEVRSAKPGTRIEMRFSHSKAQLATGKISAGYRQPSCDFIKAHFSIDLSSPGFMPVIEFVLISPS